MKKPWAAILFNLVMLTQLDGSPVWVEISAIQAIRPAREGQCHVTHGAAIRVGGMGMCVMETPEQIRDKIRHNDANGNLVK